MLLVKLAVQARIGQSEPAMFLSLLPAISGTFRIRSRRNPNTEYHHPFYLHHKAESIPDQASIEKYDSAKSMLIHSFSA